ncbi:Concanavalin A-like lectin/glucanase, subgroup [Artemisia annua]|uniref:Concanavalin A-like lectin/glucanase, subgroup n=1 Tax=Artemisia annua TaxID=35608 RepID=A0A2U1LHA8_ARTAN|nr:Concanavalin A-like lectin/glucanase, subgroup [Artemisia annua]
MAWEVARDGWGMVAPWWRRHFGGHVGFGVGFVAFFGIIAYLCTRIYNMPEDTFGKDINDFLDNMEREKPIRFTSKQLKIATENFSNVLGSGAFGIVYKGTFKNGLTE